MRLEEASGTVAEEAEPLARLDGDAEEALDRRGLRIEPALDQRVCVVAYVDVRTAPHLLVEDERGVEDLGRLRRPGVHGAADPRAGGEVEDVGEEEELHRRDSGLGIRDSGFVL